ncbi:hypothetical protein VTO73DRAFT_13048 [Trametes versicolor]
MPCLRRTRPPQRCTYGVAVGAPEQRCIVSTDGGIDAYISSLVRRETLILIAILQLSIILLLPTYIRLYIRLYFIMVSPAMFAFSGLLAPLAAKTANYALVSQQADDLKNIKRIIEWWRAVLGSLTDQQTAILEQRKPAVLHNMYLTLNDMSTCVTLLEVELERTSTLTLLWQRVWPRTELSGKRIVQATAETVAATVNAFPNFDIVSAVLAVDVALAALNAEHTRALQQASVDRGTVAGTEAPDVAVGEVSPETMTAYQSIVANIAAFLPPFLQGVPRSSGPDGIRPETQLALCGGQRRFRCWHFAGMRTDMCHVPIAPPLYRYDTSFCILFLCQY